MDDNSKTVVIAFDGTAASGKGTTAAEMAWKEITSSSFCKVCRIVTSGKAG